jgi:two-component system, NtrC family, response regulator AtoC
MDRRILVVDDSEAICQQLATVLAKPGRRITVVHDGTSALEFLVEGDFSLVLVDLQLPGINGLDLIREIDDRDLPVTPILMTGYASIPTVVDALKLGAYDFIDKPVDIDHLEIVIEKALEDRLIQDEVRELRRGLQDKYSFHNLLGKSETMRAVFQQVARVASSPCTVLVTGETGTGKELVAQALHYNDSTRTGPLISVNCAAIPESLLESEFFGHERGAFTGADRLRKGRFELAKGGTLLLDELGTLPLGIQAKLLRVLQDGTFERVGGGEMIQADCRIIASTNADLGAAVKAGQFREDLYYRLNVVSIELPNLRSRLEDLPMLVEHFLRGLAQRGFPAKSIERGALARLARFDWPGNVRELEHVVEQMVVTTPGDSITPENVPPHLTSTREEPFSLEFDPARPLQEITEELTERIERAYLERVLERHNGRIAPTAAHCRLSRRSISEKLRRYAIDKADFKPRATRRASVVKSA